MERQRGKILSGFSFWPFRREHTGVRGVDGLCIVALCSQLCSRMRAARHAAYQYLANDIKVRPGYLSAPLGAYETCAAAV